VLYGTDWPLASMESYLAFMDELALPSRDKDLMFFENAARLFKLPVTRGRTGLGALFQRL
jgi:predicted TIM-barrel fold metal-dependent hydrolase